MLFAKFDRRTRFDRRRREICHSGSRAASWTSFHQRSPSKRPATAAVCGFPERAVVTEDFIASSDQADHAIRAARNDSVVPASGRPTRQTKSSSMIRRVLEYILAGPAKPAPEKLLCGLPKTDGPQGKRTFPGGASSAIKNSPVRGLAGFMKTPRDHHRNASQFVKQQHGFGIRPGR